MTTPSSASLSLPTHEETEGNDVCAQAVAEPNIGWSLGTLSVEAARRTARRQAPATRIGGAALDARIIVGHALGGLEHTALAAQAHRVLTPKEAETIAALAARRLAHEPIARILGYKEFWGLPFKLNPETFCHGRRPRPWSRRRSRPWLATIFERARCASPTSAPARARCCWHCSSELARKLSGSAPISVVAALDCARDNAAAQRPCFIRGLRLWSGARGADRCPRLQSALRRAPGDCNARKPRCATSILAARSMADPTGLMAIVQSQRMRAACSRPRASWWWNSGRDRARRP